MEINEKLIEKIEAYLDQSLSSSAHQLFEAEIMANPILAEEVELQQGINLFLDAARRRYDTKNKLDLIAQNYSYTPSLWQQPRFWSYSAAAAVVIVVLTVIGWPKKQSPAFEQVLQTQLHAYSIESFPISASIWRDGEDIPPNLHNLVDAKALYKQHAYDQAFNLLDKISHIPEVEQTGTLFYKGMCLMMTEKWEDAKALLLNIPTSDHLYFGLAQWYTGLIEAKLGNYSSAREHLNLAIDQQQLSKQEVQQIEQLLESLPH